MKTCSLCKKNLPEQAFRTRVRSGKKSLRSHCKPCESKDQIKRNRKKMQEDLEFKRESLGRVAKWGKENKGRRLKADADRRRKKYQTEVDYRTSVKSSSASYRSQKLQAEPPWLSSKDRERAENIYRTATKVSEITGKPHDVDHVIPLQGKNICGLHVWWNLAIIPASMNRSKSNAHPSFNSFP